MPLKFYLVPVPNKKGEHPIRVSIEVKNTRLMTTIGYSVSKEVWLPGEQVKARYTNSKGVTARTINTCISKIKIHFNDYENRQKTRPTQQELRTELDNALALGDDLTIDTDILESNEKTKSIFEHFDEFIREQGQLNQWAHATHKCWRTFKKHLTSFGRRLEFEDFNENGCNRFIIHLRKTCGLEEKTVQKNFNCLKWFLNWAIRKGYSKEDYISKYRPKFKVLEKPVIFLTREELLKLYKYEIPASGTMVKLKDVNGKEYEKKVEEPGALAKTRDLFCFCAFTSLRYSDMAALKRTDITDDCIYITTQKTNDRLPIDLNKFSKAILDKYKNEEYPMGLALPVISNQKMNKYIKTLCELCGFTEPITKVCYRAGQKEEETLPKYAYVGTHCARRTFICYALSSGIAPQVVMKWTGHSDYKAMRPYIDIAANEKAKAMSIFEAGLE